MQLCVLGAPGLCESDVDLQVNLKENGEDGVNPEEWQHLWRVKPRGLKDQPDSKSEGFILCPEANRDDVGTFSNKFIRSHKSAEPENDILVIGLAGNHFGGAKADMSMFEHYTLQLVDKVINNFPGRIVVLNYSPQHFGDTGAYSADSQPMACGPKSSLPRKSVHMGSIRNAIWDYTMFKYATKPYAHVDANSLLDPLWSCHRIPVRKGKEGSLDCTHWTNPIYTLLADHVIYALVEREKERE